MWCACCITRLDQARICTICKFKICKEHWRSHWPDSSHAADSSVSYLITWVCVCERLAGSKLVKKFPTFYGTRRFITTFTSAGHLSLSWASSIQSVFPQPNSWRSILKLSTHLHLGLPSGFGNISGTNFSCIKDHHRWEYMLTYKLLRCRRQSAIGTTKHRAKKS